MQEEKKVNVKNRLSPESTILLTIGGTALAIVVYRLLYYIITGS